MLSKKIIIKKIDDVDLKIRKKYYNDVMTIDNPTDFNGKVDRTVKIVNNDLDKVSL